tara:strand:- start:702 stop:2051 length:1350 start_codon:yes stop_codon:yes gene_type:complete
LVDDAADPARHEAAFERARSLSAELADADADAARRDAIATSFGRALAVTSGTEGITNRLRNELVRGLGSSGSPAAVAPLAATVRRVEGDQHFLFNRMAVVELGRLGDEAAIPVLIEALYLFDPDAPTLRADDVAAEALVRVGRAAVTPLLETLRGANPRVNAIVDSFITILQGAGLTPLPSREEIVHGNAMWVLGSLGGPGVAEALLAETEAPQSSRRSAAAGALLRLAGPVEGPVRERVEAVFSSTPAGHEGALERGQLLGSMGMALGGAFLPFLRERMVDLDLALERRVQAARLHARLADGAEVRAADATLARLPEDDELASYLMEPIPSWNALARRCGDRLACYRRALADAADGDGDAVKAATMAGRFGVDDPATLEALVDRLDSRDVALRVALFTALDHAATHGSPRAVARIARMRIEEEGEPTWHAVAPIALMTQARLQLRADP